MTWKQLLTCSLALAASTLLLLGSLSGQNSRGLRRRLSEEASAGSCQAMGCGASYQPSATCQCNSKCTEFGNCCSDFQALCSAPAADVPQPEADAAPASDCIDTQSDCGYWASSGECDANPAYMQANCKKACGTCKAEEKVEAPAAQAEEKAEALAEKDGNHSVATSQTIPTAGCVMGGLKSEDLCHTAYLQSIAKSGSYCAGSKESCTNCAGTWCDEIKVFDAPISVQKDPERDARSELEEAVRKARKESQR